MSSRTNLRACVDRVGLYEYLGRPVSGGHATTTTLTNAHSETYDDDAGLEPIGVPCSEATLETRQDSETYDDDAGLEPLSVPWLSDGTSYTVANTETYDDDGCLDGLGTPSDAHPMLSHRGTASESDVGHRASVRAT